MTYYSGTSRENYELELEFDRRFPDRKSQRISCFEEFVLAKAFAFKRAKQDNSSGVVIEITDEKDFDITFGGYPILIGKLTPKNHMIYLF